MGDKYVSMSLSAPVSPFRVSQSQHVLQRAETRAVHHLRRELVLHVRSLGLGRNRIFPHLQNRAKKRQNIKPCTENTCTNRILPHLQNRIISRHKVQTTKYTMARLQTFKIAPTCTTNIKPRGVRIAPFDIFSIGPKNRHTISTTENTTSLMRIDIIKQGVSTSTGGI